MLTWHGQVHSVWLFCFENISDLMRLTCLSPWRTARTVGSVCSPSQGRSGSVSLWSNRSPCRSRTSWCYSSRTGTRYKIGSRIRCKPTGGLSFSRMLKSSHTGSSFWNFRLADWKLKVSSEGLAGPFSLRMRSNSEAIQSAAAGGCNLQSL